MRLDGPPPPVTRDSTQCIMMSLGLLTGSVPGDRDSTTRMSPLGSTYSERGCSKPAANFLMRRPGATDGVSASFHPTTDATRIGGNRYCWSAGRRGLVPIWEE